MNVYIVELNKPKAGSKMLIDNPDALLEQVYCGYHPNLEGCLLAFLRKRTLKSSAQTFEELFTYMDETKLLIKEFCKNIDKALILEKRARNAEKKEAVL